MAHISIKNLSLYYPIYDSDAFLIKNSLFMWKGTGGNITKKHKILLVNALNNVSLEINDGERIGLLGHNGAGKTTLLRLIAGIYLPSSGRIEVSGNVVSLLDTVSGMRPEATGLENIYLRSYMLGKTKDEIDEKLDEIIEFSELGDFVHIPIKRYSSGMYARLAFSISTAYTPEILLIDEGIGAGDSSFQKKAKKRLKDFTDSTKILILASHSKALLADNCNKILTLDKGKILKI